MKALGLPYLAPIPRGFLEGQKTTRLASLSNGHYAWAIEELALVFSIEGHPPFCHWDALGPRQPGELQACLA